MCAKCGCTDRSESLLWERGGDNEREPLQVKFMAIPPFIVPREQLRGQVLLGYFGHKLAGSWEV